MYYQKFHDNFKMLYNERNCRFFSIQKMLVKITDQWQNTCLACIRPQVCFLALPNIKSQSILMHIFFCLDSKFRSLLLMKAKSEERNFLNNSDTFFPQEKLFINKTQRMRNAFNVPFLVHFKTQKLFPFFFKIGLKNST